ncbi:MAG: hypothetical protein ABI780_03245 [Ardenticatenales bacterium]
MRRRAVTSRRLTAAALLGAAAVAASVRLPVAYAAAVPQRGGYQQATATAKSPPPTPPTPPISPTAPTSPTSPTSPIPSTPAAPRPYPPLARPVFLPALASAASAAVDAGDASAPCDGWIHVQSVGVEPSRAVLIEWGDAGGADGSAGACARPMRVTCSGLLGPGAVWRFPIGGAAGAAGAGGDTAVSGVIVSFNVRTLREIGVAAPGDADADEPVSERLCRAMAQALPASCEGYRAFRGAYDQGEVYAGVPLRYAYGAPLAAHVERACRSGAEKLVRHAAGYNGIVATGGIEELLPIQSYHAHPAVVPDGRTATILHVQNRSANDASVEAWFKPDDVCGLLRLCHSPFMLPPGRSARLDLAGCGAPGEVGAVVLNAADRSPLAVSVDIVGADRLLSYTAVPAEFKAAIDGPALFTPGSPVAFGPLARDPRVADGATVHVHNLDAVRPARVRLTVLDAWGSPEGPPLDRVVCAGGGETVRLPTPAAGVEVGSVRVESVADPVEPDDPRATAVPPPNISAVVALAEAGGSSGGPYGARAAVYTLAPEQQAFRWPSGAGRCGAESGVALIALPAVDGATDRLYVANAVPNAGVTQVAVLLFDQNGLIDGLCRPVTAQQSIALDLASHGLLGSPWRGGALVSAAWWSHSVLDARRVRNVVGLTALVLHRPAAADLGDALTAAVGLPQRPNRDLFVGRIPGTSAIDLGCAWPPPRRDMGSVCGRALDRVYLPWVAGG